MVLFYVIFSFCSTPKSLIIVVENVSKGFFMNKMIYDHKAVGERIRRRRMDVELTQAELAERLGLSIKYCADIERGYCGMSIDTLLLFCEVLELTPSSLLLGEVLPYAGTADTMSQIALGLTECTPEQLQNILETVRLFTQCR